MSLLPYFYDLHRLPRHQFGIQWAPEEYDYTPPLRHLSCAVDTAAPGKDEWSFSVDVGHFSPDEIAVKTVDRFVVVEGSHEERRDEHGAVTRRFVRRHALPEGCLAGTVRATLSSDGVLTVSAPRKLALPDKGERIVPVERNGPVPRRPADASMLAASDPAVGRQEHRQSSNQ